MDAKTPSRQAFSKVLRAFQSGRIGLEELLAHIDQELASGSAPSDIRGILRLSEFIEPLPDAVIDAVKQRLNHRPRAPKPGEPSPKMGELPADEPASPNVQPDTAAREGAAIHEIAAPTTVDPGAREPIASSSGTSPPALSTPAASAPVAPTDVTESTDISPTSVPSTNPATPVIDAQATVAPAADVAIPESTESIAPAASSASTVVDEDPTLRVPMPPATGSPTPATAQDPTVAEGVWDSLDTVPITIFAQPVAVGRILKGRYRLIQRIGESTSSDIYKAVDLERLDSAPGEIAVKLMSRPFVELDQTFTALQRYVNGLANLRHPSIVRIFACERDAGSVFMTMEYLGGESLAAGLEREAQAKIPTSSWDSSATARSIISAVANALDFAHQNSVVHGKLTPEKVIVTAGEEPVKVIGFEIPGWIGQPKTALERREAAGKRIVSAVTPQYASPQLLARQRPEVRDDIYALACLAYRLLTGWHPFDDGTGAQTLRFPPPSRPGISSSEYAAVLRALALERSNRTASVREFITEFESTGAPSHWKSRLAWGGAGAVLIAAVVTAVIAGFYLHSRPEIAPPVRENAPVAPRTPESPVLPTAARPKPGSVIRDCPGCLPMTVLPRGRFEQGASNADTGATTFERPQHSVTIAYEFAMSTDDVTVGDFQQFAAASGRRFQGCDTYDGQWKPHAKADWQNPGFEQDAQHPVTCVSWGDAVAYANWLSNRSGHVYRLPSASEWEYAARAGAAPTTPWGADRDRACKDANVADASAAQRYPGWDVFPCDDGNVYTAKIGSYRPNAFGLNDMLGNVFVWTEDCWHDDYEGAPADGSARVGGSCREHELRGGSWFSSPQYVTASHRNHFASDYRTSSVGFRLVREIDK